MSRGVMGSGAETHQKLSCSFHSGYGLIVMKTRKIPWVPLALCFFLLAAVVVIIAVIAALAANQLP